MDDMEEKLSSILGNPQMMQQIMAMAQNLSQAPETVSETPKGPPQKTEQAPKPGQFPGGLDPGMVQRIYGIIKQTGIDKNQQALLKALTPYLNRDRIQKLEKAMHAAKIAGVASAALGSTGLSLLTGR